MGRGESRREISLPAMSSLPLASLPWWFSGRRYVCSMSIQRSDRFPGGRSADRVLLPFRVCAPLPAAEGGTEEVWPSCVSESYLISRCSHYRDLTVDTVTRCQNVGYRIGTSRWASGSSAPLGTTTTSTY